MELTVETAIHTALSAVRFDTESPSIQHAAK